MFELQHDFGMLGRAAGVGLIGLCSLQPIRSQQWTQVTNQRPDMSCGRVSVSQRDLSSSAEVEMGCPDITQTWR